MRERGLADREDRADDVRGTVIVLTDAGRAAIGGRNAEPPGNWADRKISPTLCYNT
jgi:DNA-binding MarR family transcriptional regulator